MAKLKSALDYALMLSKLDNTDMVAADELTIGLASNFSYKNAEYGKLEQKRALFINDRLVADEKGKVPPKTRIDTEWEATEDGQYMLALHRERQSMKLLIKAVESHAFMLRSEASLRN